MTIVSTMATTKDDRIYVRVTSEIKDDFEAVAEFRGLKTSTFLHSLIVKAIHETKKESPEIFEKVRAEKQDGIPTKTLDEIQENKRLREEKNKK
jgi:antitoxin component of RelBE/YafQ-DinJ toxin-antitoxin module